MEGASGGQKATETSGSWRRVSTGGATRLPSTIGCRQLATRVTGNRIDDLAVPGTLRIDLGIMVKPYRSEGVPFDGLAPVMAVKGPSPRSLLAFTPRFQQRLTGNLVK